jgi:death-on-curing protein
MTEYPTLSEVLAIHALSVESYGGSAGVRDLGSIEAALFRPQSGYYADIIEEAAALLESFLINHPFADGNKRTAFAVCHVFLDINGYNLDADPAWLHGRILHWLGEKEERFATMAGDLRIRVTKRPPQTRMD